MQTNMQTMYPGTAPSSPVPGYPMNPSQTGNAPMPQPWPPTFYPNSGFPTWTPQSPVMNAPSTPVQQQTQVQAQQSNGFVGRCVNDPMEILPNEVPMDGRIAIFPANDLSAVFIKGWNANGNMMTVRYIPDPNWQAPVQGMDPNDQQNILRRLDNIEKAIASGTKGRNNKSGQEGGNNGVG